MKRGASHTAVLSERELLSLSSAQRRRHGSGSLGSRLRDSALHAGGSIGGTPENNTYPGVREAGLSGWRG